MEKRRRYSSIDRLSDLPDDIICHILSFLPTNLSGSTALLSKRWRSLWAHVPVLDFKRDDFRGHVNDSDVINRVMLLYKGKTLDTLRIRDVICNAHQLETWMTYAIQRSVRNLYIDVTSDYRDIEGTVCTLPRCLLTCKTVVDMKLDGSTCIPSVGEVLLPSLKKLHLSKVEYEDDQALSHFLSGCPVLEELIVNDCYWEEQKNSGCVVVSSPTIKKLHVDYSYDSEEDEDDRDYPDYMLMINAPALMYLKVDRCALEDVLSLRETMPSLIEAEFSLNREWLHEYCCINGTKQSRAIKFLSSLRHVKCLKLSSDFGDVLIDIGNGPMLKFDNLTYLEIELTVNWNFLAKFLGVADNLQVLDFNLDGMPVYTEPERVPKCMTRRLRTVRIYEFGVVEDCFDVVRYILRNAQVLEWMEIYPERGTSYPEKLDALGRISLFERGSKLCQLSFEGAGFARASDACVVSTSVC